MTSVIIPYRDRAEHLAILAPRLAALLPEAEILVIEQGDNKPFNRAKLLNVGALNAKGEWLIMHDVDMVPVKGATKYIEHIYPTYPIIQLAYSTIQTYGYLGGVTAFIASAFRFIGGYHNEYWHRAEDNELAFNIARRGITIKTLFTPFEQLNHTRPAIEFDPALWKKAQEPRTVQDQLRICQYEVTETTRHDYYTKITVNL